MMRGFVAAARSQEAEEGLHEGETEVTGGPALKHVRHH